MNLDDMEKMLMQKQTSAGALRAAALAAAALVCAAGCFSVPSHGASRKIREIRKENASGMLDARVEPVVDRVGRDALVRFRVSGTLTNSCETSAVYERDRIGTARFGFFPGVRPEEAQCAFLACWYNVCMLGTPTLNGLLAEWFRPPDESDGFTAAPKGVFRRSAIFGYYSEKSRTPRKETVHGEPASVVKTVDSLFLPVGPQPWQISVSVSGADASYENFEGAGCVRLAGVYRDDGGASPESCRATLSVPSSYGLKAELADDEKEPVEIRL